MARLKIPLAISTKTCTIDSMMKNETLKSAARAVLVFAVLGAFAVLMGLLSAPL
jgi:hypothetical protein